MSESIPTTIEPVAPIALLQDVALNLYEALHEDLKKLGASEKTQRALTALHGIDDSLATIRAEGGSNEVINEMLKDDLVVAMAYTYEVRQEEAENV